MADAAAVAAANGIDVALFRETGVVRLDPSLASDLALDSLARQPGAGDVVLGPDWFAVWPDGVSVVITLRRTVDLTLLRIAGGSDVDIGASGRAVAQVRS
jgi:hypothetical protein